MSDKPYTSYIDSEEKNLQGDITIDWDLYTMATFDATIIKPELLNGFDKIVIQRDEIDVFSGRVENYNPIYSREGGVMRIGGFDDTVRLRDYKTPIQSLAGTNTVTVLGNILTESPFLVSTSGTFEYMSALLDWETWIDWALSNINLANLSLELDLDYTVEVNQNIYEETFTICNIGLKAAFVYDGGTIPRMYAWAKDAAGGLYYYHSTDGITWAAVDSTWNPSGDAWSVSWTGSEVIVFEYDGANTDFHIGTIANATGIITWTGTTGNIFAGTIRFGPVFDDDGHYWVIASAGGGTAYESTDAGTTWGNIFGPGGDELWALGQVGADGDMIGIVLDVGNTDLEEWLWDRSAGTFTFQNKIADENDIEGMDACQDNTYNMYVAWNDNNVIYIASDHSGAWLSDTALSGGIQNYSIGSDRRSAYLFASYAGGVVAHKYYDTTLIQSWANADSRISTPAYISCPRGGFQDGEYRIFMITIDNDNDLHVVVYHQYAVRLAEGETAATVQAPNVTASADFTGWGLVTTDGDSNIYTGVSYDVYDLGGIIVGGQPPSFDLRDAGVDTAHDPLILYMVFDGTTVDPLVYEFSISERRDYIVFSTDGEDCFTAVSTLSTSAGADFWVEDNGDGTYTLHFSTRRGEDKSGWITLKCASNTDEVDTKRNIKVLSKTFDWTNFANSVLFLGGTGDDGERVKVEVQNLEDIEEREQPYWITIRDATVTTSAMGRTLAALELEKRNAVIVRIVGEFVDKHDSNAIQIGDSVSLIGEWDDGDLKIEGSHRIVRLTRSWGTGGGERVTAEFTNRMKPTQYYNYLQKVDSLERLSVQ